MTKHQREAPSLDTISDCGAEGSVEHSSSSKKPIVLKCSCLGTEVPFYCPVHGRVENPNWPLLKRLPELEAYILAGVDQLKLEHEQTKLIEDGQKAIEAKPQSDGD